MKQIAIVAALIGLFYFYRSYTKESVENTDYSERVSVVSPQKQLNKNDERQVLSKEVEATPKLELGATSIRKIPMKTQVIEKSEENKFVTYKIEDGLAVISGDIVIGAPKSDDVSKSGLANVPEITLWENGIVPFFIQPTVLASERVTAALEFFRNTPIRFVEYSNQEDVLVFESAPGTCKSYLGKIGGKQPIWISDECSPVEIAHEIMHALGFVHEQNRIDRDSFVEVLWENIEPEFKHNFEVLPSAMMLASGKSAFDYESIMMYSPSVFAKSANEPTMKSKTANQIKPQPYLSALDVSRLRIVYQ